MTAEEKLDVAIEKLNKVAFCMGIYLGKISQMVANVPDQLAYDSIKEQLSSFLSRINNDAERLFFEDTK